MKTPAYLWYDTEFSSLEIEAAELLQVALVITDADLNRILPPERDLNLYVRIASDLKLSLWVEQNLSFVLDQCRSSKSVLPVDIEPRLCDYIDSALGPASHDIRKRPIIAGNSVHADYYLSKRLLPGLQHRCHYRLLDVSVLKLQWQDWLDGEEFDKDDQSLIQTWFPGASLIDQSQAHDAYYDVQASIAELAFYRGQLQRRPR